MTLKLVASLIVAVLSNVKSHRKLAAFFWIAWLYADQIAIFFHNVSKCECNCEFQL